MSDSFAADPRDDEEPPVSGGRTRALIITAGVVVVAIFALTTFASFYTDRLWYLSVGYGEVFTRLFVTKTVLFVVFGLLMAGAVAGNVVAAYRMRPLFMPPANENAGLDRYREVVTPIRTWLVIAVAVVIGIFAGTSGAGQWRTWMLWRNRTAFGQSDAYFGKDIGFYVFDLPWYHYLVDFVMAAAFLALLGAALIHYLYGGIRLQAVPRDRFSGPAQVQLSVLLGIFVLAKAIDYWIDRYDLVNHQSSLFTGMNYTAKHAVLPAKSILAGIAIICAVLFFLNVWRRTWLLPSMGLGLLVLSAVVLGLIFPGVVQQFQVNPTEADKEAPFIATNIDATRTAYNLKDVDSESYANGSTITGTNAGQLSTQTASVPLVDPTLVQAVFEQNQQGRAFYSVPQVLDVDRYDIDGTDRALVLGARELNQAGIPESSKNWSNLHTVYTHGSGVIAAFANQRPADDGAETPTDVQYAEGLDQGQDSLTEATGGFENRIYFGENSPEYSIVGKASASSPSVELTLPTAADGSAAGDGTGDGAGDEAGAGGGTSDSTDTQDVETSTYDGSGGVAVGSTFRQLLYALKFGEPNFLLSQRVNANSKVLYERDPHDRVEKVAPWLTLDSDAYPAVVDHRIVWILDGYTATDRYPNSQSESFQTMTDDSLQDTSGLRTLPTDELNYMRNSVKATVDAYDGTVTLYAWDETDPILRAWEGAFPGTVQPKSAIGPELMEHLRYPEDLFKVQRYQYARYHVTNPGEFYQSNNRWEVPVDPNDPSHLQPPYRLFLDDGVATDQTTSPVDDDGQTWSLTSTFVPFDKANLASFMSVDSDATSPDYGKIKVLELADQRTNGPGLVANVFSNDQEVRDALLPYQTGQSPPRYGNLLTLPIQQGLIFVEPVYATRAGVSGSFPQLTFVLVSFGDEAGIGSTLTGAIGNLLGVTDVPDGTGSNTGGDGNGGDGNGGDNNGGGDNSGGTGSINDQIRSLLNRADAAFTAANQSLQDGDLAGYQANVKKAQQFVNKAFTLAQQRDAGQQPSGGSSTTPSTGASASPSDEPSVQPTADPSPGN